MIVKIQSIIDVITNSSTETFVACSENTLKAVKNILQSFADLNNENKNVEDLFDFKLIFKQSYEDYIYDIFYDKIHDLHKDVKEYTIRREKINLYIDNLNKSTTDEKISWIKENYDMTDESLYNDYLDSNKQSVEYGESYISSIDITIKKNVNKEKYNYILNNLKDLIKSIESVEILC
ncbi:MAG: hypothetical protein RSE41_10650 [Clostridia bacterium]